MRCYPPIPAVQTEFLSAFAEWSGRKFTDFPTAAPPCNAVGSPDEDAVLAVVFRQAAYEAPYFAHSHPIAILTAAVLVHQRRLDIAWDASKGSAPPHVADRTSWKELRRYAAMIETMRGWLDALFTKSLEPVV